LIFVLGAAVQYNDPDPTRWIVMYIVAAIVCGAAALKRLHPAVSAAVALVTGGWALTLATIVFGPEPLTPMFGEEIQGNILVHSEEGREMGGLVIICAWMIVATLHAARVRKPGAEVET
jgi:hypothetical protein